MKVLSQFVLEVNYSASQYALTADAVKLKVKDYMKTYKVF